MLQVISLGNKNIHVPKASNKFVSTRDLFRAMVELQLERPSLRYALTKFPPGSQM